MKWQFSEEMKCKLSKYCKRLWYWNILLSSFVGHWWRQSWKTLKYDHMWHTNNHCWLVCGFVSCVAVTQQKCSCLSREPVELESSAAEALEDSHVRRSPSPASGAALVVCSKHNVSDRVSAKNASIFHSCFDICTKFCIHIPGRTNKSDNIGMETWVCEMSLEKLSPRTVSFTLASLNLSFPDTSQSYIPVSLRVTLFSLTLLLYIVTRLAYDSVEDVDNRDNLMKLEDRFSLD